MWFLDSDRVRWSISSRPDWRADGLQAILTCRMTSDDWHRQHKGWPDSALVSQLATGTFLSLLSETEHHVWSFWWLLMRCFELLGIDVMLDVKMKPYLIEAGSLLWIQPKNQRCKIWDSYKYIYIYYSSWKIWNASRAKPLQVNHLPSFTCDSPLDEDIKQSRT